MITIERVKQAEKTGQYQFPFKPSDAASSIMDETKTFEQYISNNENWFAQEYLGKRYKYTLDEMKSTWNCILVQRKYLQAALMVVDGKIIGINQGLRMLNIF